MQYREVCIRLPIPLRLACGSRKGKNIWESRLAWPNSTRSPSTRPSPPIMSFMKRIKKTKIATITFDRLDKHNTATIGMRALFAEYRLSSANIDDDVKVLVIRGNGRQPGKRWRPRRARRPLSQSAAGRQLPRRPGNRGSGREVSADPAASATFTGSPTITRRRARGTGPFRNSKKISIVEAKGYCYGWHFYQCADADLIVCVRRCAVWPSLVPLRRVGAAAVAMGRYDGPAYVRRNAVHGSPVHREGNVQH